MEREEEDERIGKQDKRRGALDLSSTTECTTGTLLQSGPCLKLPLARGGGKN